MDDPRLNVQHGPFKGKPQQWFTRAEVIALLEAERRIHLATACGKVFGWKNPAPDAAVPMVPSQSWRFTVGPDGKLTPADAIPSGGISDDCEVKA